MWIFSKYGFYSTVQHEGHPNLVVVRARVRSHLENLLENFKFIQTEGPDQIIETTDSDYRFRFIVNKIYWSQLVKNLADGINYTNFKDHCQERYDDHQLEASYLHALHDVWYIGMDLQKGDEYQMKSDVIDLD